MSRSPDAICYSGGMGSSPQRVAVLGASARPEKYSYKAVQMLLEYGHTPLPVHPSGKEVLGIATARTLSELQSPIDTVTLYVGPDTSNDLFAEILGTKARRIIMNPGAENPGLKAAAEKAGIEVVEGCTLVMLRTNNF